MANWVWLVDRLDQAEKSRSTESKNANRLFSPVLGYNSADGGEKFKQRAKTKMQSDFSPLTVYNSVTNYIPLTMKD